MGIKDFGAIPNYTSLFTITVAKIRKVNKVQQCETKQLN